MVDFNEYDKIIAECRELGIIKNKLYGDNTLKLFNGKSIFIKIFDKVERLKNIMENEDDYLFEQQLNLNKETIEDTIKDLINYSVYLLLSERKKL